MPTTTSPLELFNQGKLAEAVAEAGKLTSADPTNPSRRWLYSELLCFKGDFDRADKHLDLLATQDPQSAARAWGFRQLIRAAEAREQFFDEGRLPEFMADPDVELQHRLKLAIQLRDHDHAGAVTSLKDAASSHRACPGVHGDEAFTDIVDLDDRMGSTIEALSITGKHYLIPIAALDWIEFSPLKRAVDQLWRPGKFKIKGGAEEGEAFFPVLYAGSSGDPDEAVALGRLTKWTGGVDGVPACGRGRRDFQMGQSVLSILELNRLQFTPAA